MNECYNTNIHVYKQKLWVMIQGLTNTISNLKYFYKYKTISEIITNLRYNSISAERKLITLQMYLLCPYKLLSNNDFL